SDIAKMALQLHVPTPPVTSTRSLYRAPRTLQNTHLGMRFRCFSIPVTMDPTVPRRSEHYEYQTTIWDYDFVESLESSFTGEIYTNRMEKLKGDARLMLEKAAGSLAQLELIDVLERLGISYLFEEEIKSSLNNIYSNKDKFLKDNLYATALTFRMLRQHGFQVQQDVLRCTWMRLAVSKNQTAKTLREC
ncbi:hypothetical protein, partial [Ralstonia pseudosolanacearum]|uniref:hypothetical protein n=1 Tax=Ralstonia pseudosolanacearum TaxID=1310165 RepID=UPI003CEF8BB1